MDDFVKSAIAEVRARAVNLKGHIPIDRLPVSFHRIAFNVTGELDKIIDKLEDLSKEDRYQLEENYFSKIIKFQELCQSVDYLENNAILCLDRYHPKDEMLTELVRKICQEIKYPLVPPTGTRISQESYFIDEKFFHLRVPLLESEFLLHLPLVYHEIAHPLISTKNHPKIESFQHRLAEFLYYKTDHFKNVIIDDNRNNNARFRKILQLANHCWLSWSIEFFCDLFATYTVGPAFPWAYVLLCIKNGSNAYELPEGREFTHPADDARVRCMITALNLTGYSSDAKKIEKRWDDYLKLMSSYKDAQYKVIYPKKLLEQLTVLALKGVKEIGCDIDVKSQGDVRILLNEAWSLFQSNSSSYFQWEKEQVEKFFRLA